MEFQFYRLDRQTVNVTCSMEHEAVARWANNEMQGDLNKLKEILVVLKQYQTTSHTVDKIITGKEFSLYINRDEVMVKANILFDKSLSNELLEDDLQFYDEENMALCGLEDFIHFINEYCQFIQE